jgi:hypothetical protein
MNILCIKSFCQQNRTTTLLFGIRFFKYGRHFDYWNQPVNMRVLYLGCHEAGPCCNLVIHVRILLRSLQLFYFHFWPIY